MASRSEWLDAFLAYDFDESYFDAMDTDDAGDDTDDDGGVQSVITKMK